MVADHQHVEVLFERVYGEWPGRVGGAGEHVRLAADADDVRGVAASRAFRMVGVDGPALERRDRVVHVARLVERVGVDHHLHVLVLGEGEAAVDRRRRRSPVLVELEAHCTGADLLHEARAHRGVALAGEAHVERQVVCGLQHAADVPCARRAGGRVGACRRTGPAAHEGGDAARDRLERLLRRDEMDVRVDSTGGEDEALAGDGLGGHPDDHALGDAGHHVRISGLSDPGDAAVLDPDVGLEDAGPVDHQRIGDDAVERVLVGRARHLAHAVAQDLAAAELALVAVGGLVSLDAGDEVGIAEPDPVAGSGPEEVGIVAALEIPAHGVSSFPNPSEIARSTARAPLAGSIGPSASAFPPRAIFAPANATSCTVLRSPGSNRTALPAGMSRRMP